MQFDFLVVKEVEGSRASGLVTKRSNQCTPEQASRIASLWSALRADDQARCHIPGFALELVSGDEVIFSASICWTCNNICMSGPLSTAQWATFDATSTEARALLSLCQTVVE